MQEWTKKYNPFNSSKLISHVDYWSSIQAGVVPPPILVTLDPYNLCNFKCEYCNAGFVLEKDSDLFSDYLIDELPRFLREWGVRATCVAGGGESMLHPRIDDLLYGLIKEGVGVGVVTNGSLIHKHVGPLAAIDWVGISVDAGTPEAFSILKRVGKGTFGKVVDNIRALRSSSNQEITYKFLAHPINIPTIYEAVRIAKDTGCNYFHLRPAGKTWYDLSAPNLFTNEDIETASAQLEAARSDFEDDGFKVIGVFHKFSTDWTIRRSFSKCYAVAMTCLIEPGNVLGLCCDRRGDSRTELCRFDRLEDILGAWSSEKHIELMKSIDLKECPRCTYTPHNEIFENFVIEDSTHRFFI